MMSIFEQEAKDLIERLHRSNPDVVRLAQVVSIAVQVEPELLRSVRLALLPDIDASVEADLWFSPLVQSQNVLAMVFLPDVAAFLRQALAEDQQLLDRAWMVIKRVHRMLPPASQLEEELTWLALSTREDATSIIERRLQEVAVAMVDQDRRGLARWAIRALPRLPLRVQQAATAWTLGFGAAARLNLPHPLPGQIPEDAFRRWLPWVLPKNIPQVKVGVRLLHNGIEFGDVHMQGAHSIDLPRTNPLLVELRWNDRHGEHIEQVSFRADKPRVIDTSATAITLRTALGDIYTIRRSHRPGNIVLLRVFISSPADLQPERRAVKAVLEQLNTSPRYRDRYMFIPYTYEDSVPPIVGESPQTVVDMYLTGPDDAHIFICMLWTRMGTPVPQITPDTQQPYQSGTEYEFLTAYRAYQKRRKPLLLVYQCIRPFMPGSEFEVDQYGQVLKFFERFGREGLYATFNDIADLHQRLQRDLEQVLEHSLPQLVSPTATTLDELHTPVYFLPIRLPVNYIQRPEALGAVRAALLSSREPGGRVAATAVIGRGGIGKTVLALAICDDPAVRAAFPDGVLWATVGQNPELIRTQREWISALGGDLGSARTLEHGKIELKRLLAERVMLLVLDDVWDEADMQWLEVGGPHCAILITTRNMMRTADTAVVDLKLMSQSESRALLLQSAEGKITDLAQVNTLAKLLGHLPLLLHMVGRLLATGVTWTEVFEALQAADRTFIEHDRPSVLSMISAIINVLPSDQQQRYRELVIFPNNERLVEAVVAQLWQQTAGLDRYQGRKILADLQSLSLVQTDYMLHPLLVDYLYAVVPSAEQQRLHSALVDSYGSSENWSGLLDDVADQGYGWQRLAYHLRQAGRHDDLRRLLTDVTYLQTKIARMGTIAVLSDLALLPDDTFIRQLAGAIRLGAHVLDQEPGELINQLQGRLGSLSMLHNLPRSQGFYFLLESTSLTPPGGMLVRTMRGHTHRVYSCAISGDGRLALSGSADRTLCVWNLASGQLLYTLVGHTEAVRACAISADGRLALSGSADQTLRLWDLSSGQVVRTLKGHSKAVRACAISADGRLALSGSADQTLRLWDLSSGQVVRTLEGHIGTVRACAISADGRLALSGSADQTLRLWDLSSGQVVHVLQGHSKAVTACAISTDGRVLLSGSLDQTLCVWNLASGQLVHKSEGHTDVVTACAIGGDGLVALSGSADQTLRLWDLTSGQLMRVLQGHSEAVTACAISLDGRTALSSSIDKTLRLWNIAVDEGQFLPETSAVGVYDCTFSGDGTVVLSASADGRLRLWDTTTRETLRVYEGHTSASLGCALSSNRVLALSASADLTLRVWNMVTGEVLRTMFGHAAAVNDCAISPDSLIAVSASDDGTLKFWRLTDGGLLRTVTAGAGAAKSCAFSRDGRWVVSGMENSTLCLWDVASGQLVRVLKGHTHAIRSCTFSPDSQFVLSASDDFTLRLWSVESGLTTHVLEGHTSIVHDCVFSPDGQFVLSAGNDYSLRLWEHRTGIEKVRWNADAPLWCCAFHPDNWRLVAADSKGNMHFLRLGRHEIRDTAA